MVTSIDTGNLQEVIINIIKEGEWIDNSKAFLIVIVCCNLYICRLQESPISPKARKCNHFNWTWDFNQFLEGSSLGDFEIGSNWSRENH